MLLKKYQTELKLPKHSNFFQKKNVEVKVSFCLYFEVMNTWGGGKWEINRDYSILVGRWKSIGYANFNELLSRLLFYAMKESEK